MRNETELNAFFEYYCDHVSRNGKRLKILWALVGDSLHSFKTPNRIPERTILSIEGRDFIRYGNTVIEK
jgi:hypothetical protein